jgi:hypothetical protein
MGAMSRNKGKAGEREAAALLADLLGLDIRRRVRQHDGDSDLEGLPGWCLEIKRHATASRAEVAGWWLQAVAQAEAVDAVPALLYRRDRDQWRAVWPLALQVGAEPAGDWLGYGLTVEGTPEAFAAVVRERAAEVQP